MEFAAKVGCSDATIRNIERGKRCTPPNLQAVAGALGVDVKELEFEAAETAEPVGPAVADDEKDRPPDEDNDTALQQVVLVGILAVDMATQHSKRVLGRAKRKLSRLGRVAQIERIGDFMEAEIDRVRKQADDNDQLLDTQTCKLAAERMENMLADFTERAFADDNIKPILLLGSAVGEWSKAFRDSE